MRKCKNDGRTGPSSISQQANAGKALASLKSGGRMASPCATTGQNAYIDAPNGTLATTFGAPGSDGAEIVPPPLPRDLPELR